MSAMTQPACAEELPFPALKLLNTPDKMPLYRDIFLCTEQPLCIGSTDNLTFELVNPAFARLHGYEVDELVGAPISLVYPEHCRAALAEHIRRVNAAPRHAFDTEHITKDGRVFPVRMEATAVRDENGVLLYRIVHVQDMTAQKEAETALQTSEQRFRELAEAMPQFVWISDSDGRIEYINSQWTQFTGLTIEETRVAQGVGYVHPNDNAAIRAKWQDALQTGEPFEVEFRCRRAADGQYYWYLCRTVPIKDEAGRIQQWIGTSTNIEMQKRHQREIADLNTRLQRAMQETHHRIKNNLQVISALADLATAEGNETVPASQMARIARHARTLAFMHDLLTQETKTDNAADALSAHVVLSRLLPLMETAVGEKPIHYDVDPIPLSVNKGGSLTLLVNELVSNAVKHGRSAVQVSLREQDSAARLAVSDDGPGFPPDFAPERAANTGLELIDSLVRWDLGGTISYENRPEGGAQVVVHFPLT